MRWGELSRGTIGLLVKVCNGLKIQSFEQHGFDKRKNGFWDFSFTNILSCLAILVALVTLVIYIKDSSATTKQRDRISNENILASNQLNAKKIIYHAFIGQENESLANIRNRGTISPDGSVCYNADSGSITNCKYVYLVWYDEGKNGITVDEVKKKFSDNLFKIRLYNIKDNTPEPQRYLYNVRKNDFVKLQESDTGEVYICITNDNIQNVIEVAIDSAVHYPEFKIIVEKS